MKNYTENVKTVTTFEELKKITDSYNNDLLDGIECRLDEFEVKKAVNRLTDENKTAFAIAFCTLLDTDRKTAFLDLVNSPKYKTVLYKVESNGHYTVKESTAVFKFETLESQYQLLHSVESDKNNKPKKNEKVTIFGSRRFYGVCQAFIRNMLIANFTIDGATAFDLSRVWLDGQQIFEANDNKAFLSNSNNALEKQMNVITKFFGIDTDTVKMRKDRDLPTLKLVAQKVRQNKDNRTEVKESDVLKFVDTFFSLLAGRIKNQEISIKLTKIS